MTTRGVIRLSLANIWRRKFRTFLTVWGMSVGIGAMVLLISFASGLQKENEKQLTSSMSLTKLSVSKEKFSGFSSDNGSSAPKNLEDSDIETLRGIAHVKAVYPTLNMPVLKIEIDGKRYDGFLQGTPLEEITDSKKETIDQGAWWTSNGDASIVLSQNTISNWKIDPAGLIGKKVTLIAQLFERTGSKDTNSYSATIVGISKKGSNFGFGDALAYDLAKKISSENVQTFPGETAISGVQSADVYVDAAGNVTGVRQAIEGKGYFVTGLEELLKAINQSFLIMKIVLGIIGSIALFVALIGITNSMLMAVLERTREIGIMTALGASRRTISWLFLSEAGWLGFFGALLGIVGAYLLGQAITAGVSTYLSVTKSTNGDLSFIKFSIGPWLFFGTLIGAVAVTLIAGWLPARRAAKLDPIAALRHE